MKRTLVLGFALSVLAANAAFAGTQQESPAVNASQVQMLVQDGAERTLDQQQKQLDAAKARIAENGSSQSIDRLHKQLGVAENGSSQSVDRLHQEMNVAENGSNQSVDRLHKELGVAENGSSQSVDRLHQEMNVAENGSSQTIDRLHGNMVAESGGDTVFDAHLKA
ncbi:hypothetical protein LNN38_02425 [Pseudomonas sp. LA21]|uniref:hypothetical protein n=1 Tax=unclassified Pseudomonas TaxID=196821 RepID=UPI001FB5BF16|nr:hypothetical protein [Pseudomonas sp. LA21]MCJ1883694.1 hypothetical protein [Pseudomonas sp. LA21]